MEENIKNLIESMMYYGITVGYESFEDVIRKFNYYKGKEWSDGLMNEMPENHIARKYYNNVSSENFDEIQLIAFVKMAMWKIKEIYYDCDWLYNEEQVDELVEEICEMDHNNVNEFINDNEGLLIENPEKYSFYFVVLYMYLTSQKENSNNIEYLKKEIDLIEKCNFGSLVEGDFEITENYKYLLTIYYDLTWELAESKQYDLAKEYYNKYINFLEKYIENHSNNYLALSYLSFAYSNYAYMLWEVVGGVNDKSDELTYKAISIREKLVEKYPIQKSYLYERIAGNYKNMAYEYKKAYKKDNIEQYKEKYYELYRKAIFYREEIKKIGEYKNIDEKIKNYNELGKMYYFIFEDDKAKENFDIALEICKTEGNSDEKWMKKINEGLESLKK